MTVSCKDTQFRQTVFGVEIAGVLMRKRARIDENDFRNTPRLMWDWCAPVGTEAPTLLGTWAEAEKEAEGAGHPAKPVRLSLIAGYGV